MPFWELRRNLQRIMGLLCINYASDLHIEFPSNWEFLKQHPLLPVGDVLVLAGDIVPFHLMNQHKDFFNYLSDNFKTTYWIPGNHEYYHADIAERSGVMNEKIKNNVFLVNNTSVIHENVCLVFSTLWSHIRPAYQWQIERSLNDFHLIKYKGHRFTANRFNELHNDSLLFIKEEIKKNRTEKTAVFTHHVPTFQNYPAKYRGDILNDAFATELFDIIEGSNIDTWVYGHTHANTPEFEMGRTKLRTNQMGYFQYNEHGLYEINKCFYI